VTKDELIAYLKATYTGALDVIENQQKEPYLKIAAGEVAQFSRLIHDDSSLRMTYLMNLAAVDTGQTIEIVYNVCSYHLTHRLLFKTVIDREHPRIESVISVWPAANWYEREIWELYGVEVNGHPNLTRFLLTDDWDEGHPMRKGWTGTDFIVMPERK
jgi:NADH-quinone oxidoreductase subunit C